MIYNSIFHKLILNKKKCQIIRNEKKIFMTKKCQKIGTLKCLLTKDKETYQYSADGFIKLHHYPFKYKKKCKNQLNIHYTMENYHPKGFDIYFATRTDADLYSSYSGYDFTVKPYHSFKEKLNNSAIASSYISNCKLTKYDRIDAVKKLLKIGMKIDIFGGCFEKNFTSIEPSHLQKMHRDDRKVS